MTTLPRTLSPWSRELQLFHPELLSDLGAIVRRIAALIGNAVPMRKGEGEPNGFDGIVRRGPYDRLIHTEWLLADELPDEFARRAVMNEHLFLELGRQHPVQHPLSMVLFDAGPSQLGTPRLVHIAALIVLSRRAESAESGFGWGIVQHPEAPLLERVDRSTIERLLSGSVAREVSESDLVAWNERIDGLSARLEARVGELWMIGAERLERFRLVKNHWHLEVEDVLEIGRREVSVTVRHATRREPRVMLQLPAPDHCVRLLRDPFAPLSLPVRIRPVAPKTGISDLVPNILFTHAGAAIVARGGNGDLVSRQLTDPGRSMRVEPGERQLVVAAGWRSRHGPTAVIDTTEGVRVLHAWRNREGGRALWSRPRGESPIFGTLEEPGELQRYEATSGVANHADGFYFTDLAGQLWFGPLSPSPTTPLRLIDDSVHTFGIVTKDGLYYIKRRPDDVWQVGRTSGFGGDATAMLARDAGQQAFMGFGTGSNTPPMGALAFQLASGEWAVPHSEKVWTRVQPLEGGLAVGVSSCGLMRARPGVVFLDRDRLGVVVRDQWESLSVYRSATPIVDAAMTPFRPILVVLTTDQILTVVSLKNGKTMHRADLRSAT